MTRNDDRWASGATYEGYIGRWSRRIAPQFLDWLGVAPGARWLDVGAGTGALTQAILERCSPASVVSVEPAEPFREHALAAIHDPRVRFVAGTADATGLPGDLIDAVVSGLVLNFVPDIDAALAEARRVVVQGGTVAAYVWDYAGGMELLRRFWDAAIALDPDAAALDEAVRFPFAAADPLRHAFEAAGFADVATRAIEVATPFASFDDLWRPFVGGTGPAPAYVASLDEPQRVALRERLRASLPIASDRSIALTARAWAVMARAGV